MNESLQIHQNKQKPMLRQQEVRKLLVSPEGRWESNWLRSSTCSGGRRGRDLAGSVKSLGKSRVKENHIFRKTVKTKLQLFFFSPPQALFRYNWKIKSTGMYVDNAIIWYTYTSWHDNHKLSNIHHLTGLCACWGHLRLWDYEKPRKNGAAVKGTEPWEGSRAQ